MTGFGAGGGKALGLAALTFLLLVKLAGAREAPALGGLDLSGPRLESPGDSLKVIVPGVGENHQADGGAGAVERRDRHGTIIGTSLFSSGVFLCSWGIASWEFDRDQCCPARNTENVIKIVVGVLLVNAGLFYLLGGAD
jgi:hypothetical protein